MGFFDGIKSALKVVGKIIGEGVESVGDFLGVEKIRNFGKALQDACTKTSIDIGETPAYDPRDLRTIDTTTDTNATTNTTKNASKNVIDNHKEPTVDKTYIPIKPSYIPIPKVDEVVKINEILAGFSLGLQSQSDRIEQNCIAASQKCFDDLIMVLMELDDVNFKTDRLKKTSNKIKSNINGFLKNYLSKRISVADNECARILRMKEGEHKRNAMVVFGRKVISEALENLSKQIDKIVKEQNQEIDEFLKDALEKQKKELSTMKNQFEFMASQAESEVLDKEQAKLTPLVFISAADVVLSSFDSSDQLIINK